MDGGEGLIDGSHSAKRNDTDLRELQKEERKVGRLITCPIYLQARCQSRLCSRSIGQSSEEHRNCFVFNPPILECGYANSQPNECGYGIYLFMQKILIKVAFIYHYWAGIFPGLFAKDSSSNCICLILFNKAL